MPWIKVELIDRGYVDPRTGKKVSIEGRRNRPKIDPFAHLGMEYPAFIRDRENILEQYQKGTTMLFCVKTVPKIDPKFEAKEITEEEAKSLKRNVFGILEKVESGVS